jgi:hypothetical protein
MAEQEQQTDPAAAPSGNDQPIKVGVMPLFSTWIYLCEHGPRHLNEGLELLAHRLLGAVRAPPWGLHKGLILTDPTRHRWRFRRAGQACTAAWLALAVGCLPGFGEDRQAERPMDVVSVQRCLGRNPQIRIQSPKRGRLADGLRDPALLHRPAFPVQHHRGP